MKTKIGTLTPKGNHMYTDSYGKLIIGDEKRKKAYVITKDKQTLVYICQNRYMLSLLLLLVLGFYIQWLFALVIAGICLLGLEGIFRYLLSHCMKAENVKFPKKITRRDKMMEERLRMNVLRIVIALVFPVLLFINLFSMVDDWSQITNNADQMILLIVTILCTLYSLYICYVSISVALVQKKQSL